MLSARSVGTTYLTMINGVAEVVVPIAVEAAPAAGPRVIGAAGGVVSAADGSLVTVAPGALPEDTEVSIGSLGEADLPYLMPDGFQFAAGFSIDTGDQVLSVPMQLAIKVPQTLAPGTKVFFFRADLLPDENGDLVQVWMQEDSGIVGADGYARTSSPPYTGPTQPGIHFVGFSTPFAVGEVRGRIFLSMPILGIDSAAAIAVMSLGASGVALGAPFLLGSMFALTLQVGMRTLKIVEIPQDTTLPRIATTQVEVRADRVATFETTFNNTPVPGGPGAKPVITKASLTIDPVNGPVIDLEGQRFTFANPAAPNPLGSQVQDIKVRFTMPGNRVVTVSGSDIIGGSATTLKVKVPQSVTLGIATISVIRPQYSPSPTGWRLAPKTSPGVRLDADSTYVFAALGGNQVGVIDRSTNELAARVPVGAGAAQVSTRTIAVSPDGTRAYVTLRGGGGVSVIDTRTLQEIDVDRIPDNGVTHIDLLARFPGAQPFWAVADPRGQFLYVGDESKPIIYVININPSVSRYHQIGSIAVTNAPNGLRGMDISADGKRLYVAAPAAGAFASRNVPDGNILVFGTDPSDSATFLKQIGSPILAGPEPYGVTASIDPRKIAFTNRKSDPRGLGLIQADASQTSWTVSYVPMHLGPSTDYFDVNNISAVAILPDLSYAFVSAWNQFIQDDPSHDPNYDPAHPAGSNIGIVKDPFGLAGGAQLVAATRPIPNAFMDNLVLSPDGKNLYAGYRGNGAVFVFDVPAMLAEVQAGMAFGDRLQRFPVDDLVNGQVPVDHFNPLIDIRADYRIMRDSSGFPAKPYTFTTIDPALAPIGTGGIPQGLDAQPLPPAVSIVAGGLNDYFFKDDTGVINLVFSNPIVAGRAGRNAVVEITVIGNTGANRFVDNLATQTIILAPGASRIVHAEVSDLLNAANVRAATTDTLYGARVQVRGYAQNAPGTPLLDEQFFVYRLLDVGDLVQTDGVVEIARTVNDGSVESGGAIRQTLPLTIRAPAAAAPTLTYTDPANFRNDGFPNGFVFDPTVTQAVVSSNVEVHTPDNQIAGTFKVQGQSVGKTQLVFNFDGLKDTLRKIAAGSTPQDILVSHGGHGHFQADPDGKYDGGASVFGERCRRAGRTGGVARSNAGRHTGPRMDKGVTFTGRPPMPGFETIYRIEFGGASSIRIFPP